MPSRKDLSVRPTGIPELDLILHGGLPSDATVLLAGKSGTGKTILATQWIFAGYQKYKEPGVYISMTEFESHFVKNLKKMSYWDKQVYSPNAVHFIDLRQVLELHGIAHKDFDRKEMTRLCESLFEQIADIGAKRVVLDSVTAIGYRIRDPYLIRDFIFQLGGYLSTNDASVLLTSEAPGDQPSVFGVEEFIADGVIRLDRDRSPSGEPVRTLQVVKMRGTDYESYPVSYDINRDGIKLYPRIAQDLAHPLSTTRYPSAVPGFDDMLGGGLFEGSSTLLSGASGTGKTILAMQTALGLAAAGKNVVYLSFEESRGNLVRAAGAFGWDIEAHEREGRLTFISLHPQEMQLDQLLSDLQATIEEHKPALIIIDSITALKGFHAEEPLHAFASQLISSAKSRGISTMVLAAAATLLGTGDSISGDHLSTLTDNIVLVRYVEIGSEMRHGLLVLKSRGSDHDRKLREFIFTPKGIRVLYDFRGYENVLSGGPRKSDATVEDQLRALFIKILGPFGERLFLQAKARGFELKHVKGLLKELGDQGLISRRRKDEFLDRAEKIFKNTTPA